MLQIGGPNYKISDAAVRSLKDYEWPGNIRELRNAIERAVIAVRRRKAIEISPVDVSLRRSAETLSQRGKKVEFGLPSEVADLSRAHYDEFLKIAEREYLKTALELAGGKPEIMAKHLGISRSTAFKRLKDLQVQQDLAGFGRQDHSGGQRQP